MASPTFGRALFLSLVCWVCRYTGCQPHGFVPVHRHFLGSRSPPIFASCCKKHICHCQVVVLPNGIVIQFDDCYCAISRAVYCACFPYKKIKFNCFCHFSTPKLFLTKWLAPFCYANFSKSWTTISLASSICFCVVSLYGLFRSHSKTSVTL